jgi:general secretion pathway protein B
VSILLEALRKSEKSQRAREVPTIHSEVPSATGGGRSRRLLLLVLLVPVFAVGGWFAWKHYTLPKGDGTGTVQTDAQPSPVDAAPSNDRPVAGLDVSAPRQSPVSGNAGSADQQAEKPVTPEVDENRDKVASNGPRVRQARQRTPVESYKPPEEGSKEALDTGSVPEAAETREPARRTSRSFPAVSFTPAVAAGSGNEVPAEEKPSRPQEPDLLGYWDLPDSIRAEIPEFRFTVLVYDKVPENRFVLVNGERYIEGDTQQPGLTLEEIRREGVIYSYRLYRFLVEK